MAFGLSVFLGWAAVRQHAVRGASSEVHRLRGPHSGGTHPSEDAARLRGGTSFVRHQPLGDAEAQVRSLRANDLDARRPSGCSGFRIGRECRALDEDNPGGHAHCGRSFGAGLKRSRRAVASGLLFRGAVFGRPTLWQRFDPESVSGGGFSEEGCARISHARRAWCVLLGTTLRCSRRSDGFQDLDRDADVSAFDFAFHC